MFTFSFATDTPLSDMFVLEKAHAEMNSLRDEYLANKSALIFNLDNNNKTTSRHILVKLLARYAGLLSSDQVIPVCRSEMNRIFIEINTERYKMAHAIATWMAWSIVESDVSSRVVELFDQENRKITVNIYGWYFHGAIPQSCSEL